MAQSKAATASAQKDFENLQEQIATLRNDIAGLSDALSALAGSSRDAAMDKVQRQAADIRDAGERQLRSAQQRAEEMGQQAADAVRSQPAAAVGLAVGLGFLLGFMTGRK